MRIKKLQSDKKDMDKRMENLKYLLSLLDNPKASEIVVSSYSYEVEVYSQLMPPSYYRNRDLYSYAPYLGRKKSSSKEEHYPSYHISMYGDGRMKLQKNGHNINDFKPSTRQELQLYLIHMTDEIWIFYKLAQRQRQKDQKLMECQKRLNAVAKVVQNHKLRETIRGGGRVYLSGHYIVRKNPTRW